jgi:hypothetical protein
MMCSRCAIEQHANKLQTVEEADRCIAETMEEIEAVERLLAKFPQMPAVPEGLQGIAMTPLSIYKTFQHYLAAFTSRRLELIQEMGSEARLRYELDKAIETEEYERAAEIKRQLNEE